MTYKRASANREALPYAPDFNRTAIMTMAWDIARQEHWSRRLGAGQLRPLLPAALRQAWGIAKTEAAHKARILAEAGRPSKDIAAEITVLNNRSYLGHEGRLRLTELERVLSHALTREAHEAEVQALEEKRELITSSGSRFCAVTFVKRDGSLRHMRVQPASLKRHIKGDAATDAGRKGAETRAARHPNLMPVWDAEKRAIRSVNLNTVTRIAVGGQVHEFAA